MLNKLKLTSLRELNNNLYDMPGFTPRIIDQAYLRELKVREKPSPETFHELQRGSSAFIEKYNNKTLINELTCYFKDISFDEPLRTHRYTSRCPVDVLEVNPIVGCNVNCLYCLVTDGDHSAPKVAYQNYSAYLKQKLEEENGVEHIYYFAAKTEPFQEATLQTGIAHNILREFITYFEKNPKSESKVFILSKSGKEELQYKSNGDTILDLMRELSDNLVYDTSISIMPSELYPILEPRAASNEKRLEAAVMCQESKVHGNWAVIQPIIPPYLTDEIIDDLMKKLRKANIAGFKPEFLTLSIKNLSWIGQLIRHFDKNMERELYECYIAPENINNVKHKNRLAPNHKFAHKGMMTLKKYADKHGLTMNICNWVRSELDISPTEVPLTLRKNLCGDSLIGVCKPAVTI